MYDRNLIDSTAEATTDPGILNIRVLPVLAYLARKTGRSLDPGHRMELLGLPARDRVDWHRILRTGLRQPLHLNLGIPGIEDPQHPIEENPEALLAALLLHSPTVPVILSGDLECARQEGLISEQAMSNLRNIIRDSV